MAEKLGEIMEEEQYTTKCQEDNTIKVSCRIPDNYRKLVTLLKENNVIYHTYQLEEERAFRILLKHIHHSTRTDKKGSSSTKHHKWKTQGDKSAPKHILHRLRTLLEQQKSLQNKLPPEQSTHHRTITEGKRNHSVYEMPTVRTLQDILQQALCMRQMRRRT